MVVIEKSRTQRVREIQELCDGLEDMRSFNLLTFNSLREPWDLWAIEELIGHYVNFRKLIGQEETSPDEFQLYAVCTRYPKGLKKHGKLQLVRTGIFDLEALSQQVRVIVLSRVPKAKHNALWALYSSNQERVTYGQHHYRWHCSDWSTTLSYLYQRYQHEGITMSYTLEDFREEALKDNLAHFPAKVILSHYSPEDRLAGLRPEDVLRQYKPEDVLKHYKPKERLAGLSELEVVQVSEHKGKAEMLSHQLQCRFKDVPSWVQDKIAKADLPTLEEWSLRFVDADLLHAIFEQ